jgi:hypothetical protein
MVIAPPSVTARGAYEWKNSGVSICDAPTWLLGMIEDAARPKVLTIREQALASIKIPANAFTAYAAFVPGDGGGGGNLAERRRAGWHAKVFQEEVDRVAGAEVGTRNETLFKATANLGGYILGGADFTADDVRIAMEAAAQRNGSLDDDGEQCVHDTIASGLQSNRTRRELPDFSEQPDAEPVDNVVRPEAFASGGTEADGDEMAIAVVVAAVRRLVLVLVLVWPALASNWRTSTPSCQRTPTSLSRPARCGQRPVSTHGCRQWRW